MTDSQREELKQKIIQELEQLQGIIKSHKESSKPVVPDVAIGRLTRMEAISAKGISEASLASARNRFNRLEHALRRIDADDFGICTECENPIPIKRLMLMPEATRCVRCAQ